MILEPAVVISQAQARLEAQPDLHRRITEAARNPREGVARPERRKRPKA